MEISPIKINPWSMLIKWVAWLLGTKYILYRNSKKLFLLKIIRCIMVFRYKRSSRSKVNSCMEFISSYGDVDGAGVSDGKRVQCYGKAN